MPCCQNHIFVVLPDVLDAIGSFLKIMADNDQRAPTGIKPEDVRVRNTFNLVVTASSALAMAAMGGFLCAVKQVNPTLEMRVDAVSVVGFLTAGVATWFFCRIMLPSAEEAERLDPTKQQSRRRWLIGFSVVSIVGMLASVAVSLRNIESGELRQIVAGAFFAVIVLCGVGYFSWILFKFMEKDSASLKDGECEPGDLER
jgi:hypothetical protein